MLILASCTLLIGHPDMEMKRNSCGASSSTSSRIFLHMSINVELMCSNTMNARLPLLSNVMSMDGISTKMVSFEDNN